MSTPQELTAAPALIYTQIPKQVSRKDFNRYIAPSLKRPTKGPPPKLSLSKIFNSILYVLHTGLQWNQLKPNRKELHWSNVYKWHNRWPKTAPTKPYLRPRSFTYRPPTNSMCRSYMATVLTLSSKKGAWNRLFGP